MINIKLNGQLTFIQREAFTTHGKVGIRSKNTMMCRITYKRRKHDTMLAQLTAHMVNTTRIAELKAHNCLMTLPVVEQPVLRLPVRM